MDAYYNHLQGYQYNHASFYDGNSNDCWDQDFTVKSTSVNRSAAMSRSPSASAMSRYLREEERPLIDAKHWDRYSTMRPPQGLEVSTTPYLESALHTYAIPQRVSSPSQSGPSSSYTSSGWSDRQETPAWSPGPSGSTVSPQIAYAEHIAYGFGGHFSPEESKASLNSGPCVTLGEVQGYPDQQPEKITFDDDSFHYYASYNSVPEAQEGYQPMQANEEHPITVPSNGVPSTRGDQRHAETPHLRKRRPQATRSITSPHLASKVTKRPAHPKRAASSRSSMHVENPNINSGRSAANTAFPCPFAIYSCTSTFGSKNEWKRHVNTQHIRLGYWRCDQCEHDNERAKPNDFNRKDLFIQHVRRMHPIVEKSPPTKANKKANQSSRSSRGDPEEQELAKIASRCFKQIRNAPEETGCLFCEQEFNGEGTWEERLEHIGKHFEKGKGDHKAADLRTWKKDARLEEWLAQERIIVEAGKNGWTLA